MEFIATELCSNVIRHAQSKATHFLMTLALEYYQPKVVITVTDEGHGFALEDVLDLLRKCGILRRCSTQMSAC